MKIEKRNNHKKKIVIGGMVLAGALVVGILATSYSKYRVTESVKLGEGIINYSSADFELVGMYLINEDKTETKIDTVPGTGYALNSEKTKCTVNNIEINASIEYKDNKLYFGAITSKGTKCNVYFESKPLASSTIIGSTTIKPGTNEFTGPATTVEESGLFSTQDDYGTTYYYRGVLSDDTVNNWVDFADFKWRIIRINGDGSIRMIYNGTDYSQTGEDTQIGTSAFNSNSNDNAYVGYMYGSTGASTYAATHANTTSSTIKGVLDNWYKTNIVDKNYDKYVSKEAGFCGDRQVNTGSENWWGSDTKKGYGTNATAYASYGRNHTETIETPSYSCNTNNLYTVSASSKGNKALQYPIGLINADEIIYGGGFCTETNKVYWLHTGIYYWTMSPAMIDRLGKAKVFAVSDYGSFGAFDYGVNWTTPGVRPVINLDKNIQLTGSGTTTNPFRIAE